MNDTIQTIRQSILHCFSGTLLSRITGMLRDISMAYVFGTQPAIAAFMVAFRFAHLFRRLFGEGALQSAFIPEFESLRHENKERAFLFFRDLTASLSLFLLLLIFVGCSGLGLCLKFDLLSRSNQEIVFLTLIMLPSLLFICLFGINASLLQCQKKYFITSIAPVAFNLIWILTVFLLNGIPIENATFYLALGIVGACFFQWIVTVPTTWNILKNQLSTPIWRSINIYSNDLKILLKTFSLGVLGISASQINSAIDAVFARFADLEGPAMLWYAIRIEQLPLALFGIAVAGAIAPPLARAIKGNNTEQFHHFLTYAIDKTWAFMLPMTLLLIITGDLIVSLLFNRGDFNEHSVIGTTHCLWGYAFGLIPSALILVLAPACYAKKNYKLPALASLLALGLNTVFNTIFIVYLGLGSPSVAIATSLTAWINLSFLSRTLSLPKSISKERWVITVASLAGFTGSYFLRSFFDFPFFAESILISPHFLFLITQFILSGGIFVLIFATTYYLLFIFNRNKMIDIIEKTK